MKVDDLWNISLNMNGLLPANTHVVPFELPNNQNVVSCQHIRLKMDLIRHYLPKRKNSKEMLCKHIWIAWLNNTMYFYAVNMTWSGATCMDKLKQYVLTFLMCHWHTKRIKAVFAWFWFKNWIWIDDLNFGECCVYCLN